MKLALLGFSVALTLSIVAACSDDHDHDHAAGTPSCDAIIEACHPLDNQGDESPIHQCHEAAEAEGVTEASCAAKKAECLGICKADAGA